jgi:hypothetical protein
MLRRAIAVASVCITLAACQGSGEQGSAETPNDSASSSMGAEPQPGTAPMGNTGVLPGDTMTPAGSPTGPGTVTGGGAGTSTTTSM